MGKNYYCEYCDKRIKNDLNIRRKHVDGLPHKIAKAEYMAPYRDPKLLLEEEKSKTPCTRFHSGKECKFGLYCHFSHYTRDQLKEIADLVQKQEASKDEKRKFAKVNSNQTCEKFPVLWSYPKINLSFMNLPLSLQPIDPERVSRKPNNWG